MKKGELLSCFLVIFGESGRFFDVFVFVICCFWVFLWCCSILSFYSFQGSSDFWAGGGLGWCFWLVFLGCFAF